MRKASEALSAVKKVPFFGTFKWILILVAVIGTVVVVSAVREGLYGAKQTQHITLDGANLKDANLYFTKPSEEKVWYWESYIENNIGDFKKSILGLKIGRRF